MQNFWRSFSNFFFLAVILIVLPAIIVFLARETFIWRGTASFKRDLHDLRRMSSEKNCETEFGVVSAEEEPTYRQLRFTSSRAYVLELVCVGFPDHPLVQEERVLDSFVSKVPGSAGIIARTDVPESMVGLAVFQELIRDLPPAIKPWLGWISRAELVGLSEGEVMVKPMEKTTTSTSDSLFGASPVSSCEGYGYSCCDSQLQYGMGDTVLGVPSCPDSCYARCIARPLLVSWKSNPAADWGTTVLQLSSGDVVQFYYVLDDSDALGPWTATIDYGDGLQDVVEGKDGTVEHTYTCAMESCEYVATVIVENAQGAQSAPTELSKLAVRVSSESVPYDPFTESIY